MKKETQEEQRWVNKDPYLRRVTEDSKERPTRWNLLQVCGSGTHDGEGINYFLPVFRRGDGGGKGGSPLSEPSCHDI